MSLTGIAADLFAPNRGPTLLRQQPAPGSSCTHPPWLAALTQTHSASSGT